MEGRVGLLYTILRSFNDKGYAVLYWSRSREVNTIVARLALARQNY